MQALMVSFNKSIATEFADKLKQGRIIPRQLTDQQAAFHEAFLSQETSILGEAVAGSGKSYSLLRASIALPNTQWKVKTCHGLGYSAWQGKLGKRLIVKSSKLYGLLKEMPDVPYEYFGDILKLASVAKNSGLVPILQGCPRGKPLMSDDDDTWEELGDHYECEVNDEILALTRELLKRSILSAQKGIVDFDDLLYMPVCFSGVFVRYPLVLVDEAQDLSLIQHKMLERVLTRKDGILIGCGDRRQAIYGFRGALAESIPQMIDTFSMSLYPLTVSFRCPQAVVREAQLDVPHIEAFSGAIEGAVIHHSSADSPLTLATLPATVLCRNTAPLINLALRLIGDGRGASIAGREIGKSLAKQVKKLCPKPVPLDEFSKRLSTFIEMEIRRKPSREGALRDRRSALEAVAGRASSMSGGLATTANIISIINKLYEDGAPGAVHLSTIHKAKGLEWPEVLLLDPQLIPSCYATREWQQVQESNLRYVAVTRAQRTLHYVTSDSIEE